MSGKLPLRYGLAAVGQPVATTVELEEMFNAIYANSHHVLSLEFIGFHLLEEVGEASEALKDLYTFDDSREPYTPELQATRKQRLLEEIADVFSWMFATALLFVPLLEFNHHWRFPVPHLANGPC